MRTILLLVIAVGFAAPAFGQAAAKQVLIMPVEFQVLELSAGGVLDVLPDESEASKSVLQEAVSKRFESSKTYAVTDIPDLSPEDDALLAEYTALYNLVSQEAVGRVGGGGWGHKKDAFDYTLGPGLAFLAERTGADTAVFTGGHAMRSTGGRVLLAIAAAGAGFAIPMGNSNLSLAIVDLKTGDIQWLNATQRLSVHDLETPDSVDDLLAALFKGFPNSKYHARIL